MLRAFKQAGRQPQEVDFVELHATGQYQDLGLHFC
jgi:acyl transferase domain-containing protein